MNSSITPVNSTVEKFYELKSKETAATPNELKNILVIRDINGIKELAIVQKKDLSLWDLFLAKLGFGNASFRNVADFTNRNIKKITREAKSAEISKAVSFLNEKIAAYKAAHQWSFLPFKSNPESIHLEIEAQKEQPSPAGHSIAKPETKDSLILHNFSETEFAQLEEAADRPYRALKEAKVQLNEVGRLEVPQALRPFHDRMVPEFRFATQIDPFTEERALTNQCHRNWGANLETLVELSGTRLCYPANRVRIGNSTYIQAEAPSNERLNSKAHYYQMAVESDARLLATVSTGFTRKKAGQEWKIAPHPESMDFLNPGESIEFNSEGHKYRVACDPKEELIKLPKEIQDQTDIEGPCHYHIRRLVVTKDGAESHVMCQIVPDFVSVGVPFALSQFTVDLVNKYHDGDKNHPKIFNCNTGRDRSGQVIILDSMRSDIEELEQRMPIDEILSKMDVVDQLRARGLMLAQQSTEGAGIDSIEKTLLPCFVAEIPSARRILYSTIPENEKPAFHQSINATYADWARRRSK